MKRPRALLVVLLALALLQSVRAESERDGLVIVTLNGGQSDANFNKKYGTATIRKIPGTSIYLIATKNAGDLLKKVRRDSTVFDAEEDRRISLQSAVDEKIDPRLVYTMTSLMDGRTLTTFFGSTVLKSYVDQQALKLIRADRIRQLGTGVATRVACIDTGIDPNHVALKPWIAPGVDLVDGGVPSELDGLSDWALSLLDDWALSLLDTRFSFLLNTTAASLLDDDDDDHYRGLPPAFGHGTLVAGMIHAVAPEAQIVPIRAFDAQGYSSMFRIIEAVYSAMSLNVDVLNLSFSTREDSRTFHRALDLAKGRGVILVASAGNDDKDARALFPMAYPGVIAVAATDLADRRASFSNYGKHVKVVAPGSFVVSTFPGNRYALAWGTSFSTPMVSGGIAVAASSKSQIQAGASQVINTADPIDALNPGFEKKLGKGRINLEKALKVNK